MSMKRILMVLGVAGGLTALAQNPSVKVGAATPNPSPAAGAPAKATNAPPTIPPEVEAKFKSADERNGYTLGAMIADDMVTRIRKLGYDAPNEAIARGFTEWVNGKSLLTKDETRKVFAVMQAEVTKKNEEKKLAESAKNKQEGEAFLTANKAKEGVITLPSGLQYKVLKAGTGDTKPKAEDTVICHYRGTLLDGKEFDSSYNRGEPARFALNRVIKGWTEGVQLMTPGSKWQFFIPAGLAYGDNGSPPRIPPQSTLIFEIELVGIQAAGTEATAAGGAAAQPVTSDIIKVPSKAELDKGAKIEVIKAADLEKLQKEQQGKAPKPETK
jgi:FKBP-type peptidyl-prolyl cis-trans isomerase